MIVFKFVTYPQHQHLHHFLRVYRQHEKFQPSKVFISSLDQNPNKLKICVTKLIKNKRKFLFLTYKIKALSGRN